LFASGFEFTSSHPSVDSAGANMVYRALTNIASGFEAQLYRVDTMFKTFCEAFLASSSRDLGWELKHFFKGAWYDLKMVNPGNCIIDLWSQWNKVSLKQVQPHPYRRRSEMETGIAKAGR
jgi:hypothetical protein